MRSFIFIAVVSLLAVACGGSATSPTTGATLNVRITDEPFGVPTAILVTFEEVSVHQADGGGWTTVPFLPIGPSRTCDLKNLEGIQDVLGTAVLPLGHYTQIRLTIARAVLYFVDDSGVTTCAAAIDPAGDEVGVPMEISSGQVILNRPFELVDGVTTTITLDFDAERSIRETPPGSDIWRMSPVIRVVSVVE